MLKSSEVSQILKYKESDITMTLLRNLFASFMDQPDPLFKVTDKFILPAKTLYGVEPKTNTETTLGRYFLNFFAIPEKYILKHGYQNHVFDKKAIETMETALGDMVLNDQLSTKEFAQWLDRGEWLSMGTVYFLAPTINYELNVPIKAVIQRRDELFSKFEDAIKRGDTNVVSAIEKELLDLAREHIKKAGNDGYDYYASGQFNFSNNYKKTSIVAGVVENPYTKKLDILKSNYIDGISKDEFSKFANLTIIGGYSRGVSTQESGYETKKINNSMQIITLDEPDTDCKTTHTTSVVIEPSVKSMFLNRYIVDRGKLTLLQESNINNYVGKTVDLRSPMFCKSEKICNVCAGTLYYKLGTKNAGLFSSTFSGNIMNRSMKKMHDSTISFMKIDPVQFIKKR